MLLPSRSPPAHARLIPRVLGFSAPCPHHHFRSFLGVKQNSLDGFGGGRIQYSGLANLPGDKP